MTGSPRKSNGQWNRAPLGLPREQSLKSGYTQFSPKEYYQKEDLVRECCSLALQSELQRGKHELIPLQFVWAQFVQRA